MTAVGFDYWTEKSVQLRYEEKLKKLDCENNDKKHVGIECLSEPVEFTYSPNDLKLQAELFFYLAIVLPIGIFITLSFLSIGLQWVIKGFKS